MFGKQNNVHQLDMFLMTVGFSLILMTWQAVKEGEAHIAY